MPLYAAMDIVNPLVQSNPELSGMHVPHVGFSKPTLHMQKHLLSQAQRSLANHQAQNMAKDLRINSQLDLCYVSFAVMGDSTPTIRGLHPLESDNADYRRNVDVVGHAKKIEILLKSSPQIAQTALWAQALFELRHTFDQNPNGESDGVGTDFQFCARYASYRYHLQLDDEGDVEAFSVADCRGYEMLQQKQRVSYPPWMIGQRSSHDVGDTTGAGGHALTSDALGNIFNSKNLHNCFFEQLHNTGFFRVSVTIVGAQQSPPPPGSRVTIDCQNTKFHGVVSSADTHSDFLVFATTESRVAFSSNVLESCTLSLTGTAALLLTKADAVRRAIIRTDKPTTGTFQLRKLLWGGREKQSLPFNLLTETAIPAELLIMVFKLKHKLDDDQQKAFASALINVVDGIELIDRPGGTGKSETLIAIAISASLISRKVRIVMPSNVVIDQFLTRLVLKSRDIGISDLVRPVRLYTSALEHTAGGRDEHDRDPHAADVSFVSGLMTQEERDFVLEHSIELRYALNSQCLFWAREQAGLPPGDPRIRDPSDPQRAATYLDLRASILSSDLRDGLSRRQKTAFRALQAHITTRLCETANVLLHTPVRTAVEEIRSFEPDILIFDEVGVVDIT